MEGMNPRGFFYQCLIHLSSSTIPPCTTLFICFDYEYLVQCSMITTHHSCTSIFPILQITIYNLSPKLACFQKNCHSCKWQPTEYKQTLQTNFYVHPFCSTHIMSVCLFLFFSSSCEKWPKGNTVFYKGIILSQILF